MEINQYRHWCRLKVAGCIELSPAHKVVLMTLADYVNRDSFLAWTDFDTLAENCDMDRRTVIRAINEGRRLGHIKRVRHGGRGVSNQYAFLLRKDAEREFDRVSPVSPSGETSDTLECHASPSRVSGVSAVSDTSDTGYFENTLSNTLSTPNSAEAVPSGARSAIQKDKDGLGECGAEPPKNEPSYVDIKQTILACWPSFSATLLSSHMQRYGAAKTLERAKCASRLGTPTSTRC
jgi:hypothetical protein